MSLSRLVTPPSRILQATWHIRPPGLVVAFGVFVAILFITGIYIWWRKRRARATRSWPQGEYPTSEVRSK